jgi:hypothetical protein
MSDSNSKRVHRDVENSIGLSTDAADTADKIYMVGDWYNIFVFGIYTLILIVVFLKYRNNVKYDPVAITVLILQFLALMAFMMRSMIEIN